VFIGAGFYLIAAGIVNTILMSVMERGREFGVMMAVGTSGSRIVQLVLLETSLLALAGYALGLTLGLAVTAYFASYGMDFSAYIKAMDTMPGLSGIVYPTTSPDRWVIIGVVVIVVALLAAILPAWIASRQPPLEAMDAHNSATNRLRHIRTEVTSSRTFVIFAQMALRSVFRNPRRSLITASATAFGLAAYLFLYGFADGFFEQMIRNSTQQLSGHVQVMAKGHDVDLSPQLRIDNVARRLTTLADQPVVQAAVPRIVLKGMVANPKTSLPMELVGFSPDQASRIVLRLQDRTQSTPLAQRLNRELADTSLVAQDWETLLPVVVQMIEMSQIDFYLILSVVFVVVAIGVMNTMVMSVMERTRELGVMLALGTQGSQLMLTILFEALFLSLIGMTGGTLLGVLIVAWLARDGIDLSAIAGSFETIPGITDKVYPILMCPISLGCAWNRITDSRTGAFRRPMTWSFFLAVFWIHRSLPFSSRPGILVTGDCSMNSTSQKNLWSDTSSTGGPCNGGRRWVTFGWVVSR